MPNIFFTLTDTSPTNITIDSAFDAEIIGSSSGKTFNVDAGGSIEAIQPGAADINLSGVASGDVTLTRDGTNLRIEDSGGNLIALIPANTSGTTQISFSDGTGELSADATAGTLSFGGETFAADGDSVSGGDVTGALDGTDTSDPGDGGDTTPTFTVSDNGPVEEGNTATYTVELSEAQGTETTVDYAVSLEGGATAADHGEITAGGTAGAGATGTLSFAAGETSKTIEIPVELDNETPEDGEAIKVELSKAEGNDATIGSDGSATAEITNVSPFTLTAGKSEVNEGDEITYTLTTAVPVAEDTDVEFTVVPGDADAKDSGTDQTNLQDFSEGAFNPSTVTIAAGEQEAEFTVSANADDLTELAENYTVKAEVGGETLTVDTLLLDGTGPGGKGDTFTLTTAQDTVPGTSGNDTINGLADGKGSTLDIGDDIDGGDGTDLIKISSADQDVDFGVATIQNVEDATVNYGGAAAGNTTLKANNVDFETVTATGAQGTDGGGQDLTVSEVGLGTAVAAGALVDSGLTVTFSGATGASDEATVEVAGATDTNNDDDNDVTVNAVETLNLNLTSAENNLGALSANKAETLNLTVEDGGKATFGEAAAAANATTVNIVAKDDLTFEAAANDFANKAAINVSGDSKVDLNTLENDSSSVDATGLSGGLTVTGAATTTSILGGSGGDNVTTGAVATKVELNDGDDTFDTNSLDFGNAAAVDILAGDGTDTIIIDDGAELDAAAGTHFKGFETLDIVGGQGTYDQTVVDFDTVTVSGDLAAVATVSNITDENLTITGDNTKEVTYALKDAGNANDELTVTIEGARVDVGDDGKTSNDKNDIEAGEITNTQAVETVNLVSNTAAENEAGVDNEVTKLDTNANTLNITGNHALNIKGFEDGGAVNQTIDTIDASGSTGGITMGTAVGEGVSTVGVSITGSETADTLLVDTVDGTGAGNATGSTLNPNAGGDVVTILDGGGSKADTYIVEAGDSQIGFTDSDNDGAYVAANDAENFDIVTGFNSGEDTLDVGSFGFSGQAASGLAGPSLTEAEAVELGAMTDFG